MAKPKIDRASVALRPPIELLAEIDAETLRTGASRHAEILALIADGLAARKQPALALTPALNPTASAASKASSSEAAGAPMLTQPPQHHGKGPGAAPAPKQQAVQYGRSDVLPGSRLKKK